MAQRNSVRIVEVGPRDGLQNVARPIPTATKIELVRRLAKAGLQCIELTSIVSRKAVPQLSDCKEMLESGVFKELQNIRLPVLVPTFKSLELALELNVREIAVFISATEGFSRANLRCSVEEGLSRAQVVARKAASRGLSVRGYVSCIFADPFSGKTEPSAVLHCTKGLLDAGCYEVSLGDTLGVGTPSQTRALLQYLGTNGILMSKLAGHFHDTYGQGVANSWTAYQGGLRVFDSSVGGLGGCPFAPGAKGNVASEDLAYMFHGAGISTGIDCNMLSAVGSWICSQIGVSNSSRAGMAILSKQRPSHPQSPTWTLLTSQDSELLVYRAGPDVKLVLNRPAKGNCLNSRLVSSLIDRLEALQIDKSVMRIILASTGRIFCAGMDISEAAVAISDDRARERLYSRLARLLELIDTMPQVTIARVSGRCLGGGCGLALACDVRLATAQANFTMTEARLGLCPAVISKYVIRELGIPMAREAMLSTRTIAADELRTAGVISHVAANEEALDLALADYLSRLRNTAPGAAAMCKQLVKLGWTDAGTAKQDENTKTIFMNMLSPGTEGSHGVAEFKAGRGNIGWVEQQPNSGGKAKL